MPKVAREIHVEGPGWMEKHFLNGAVIMRLDEEGEPFYALMQPSPKVVGLWLADEQVTLTFTGAGDPFWGSR